MNSKTETTASQAPETVGKASEHVARAADRVVGQGAEREEGPTVHPRASTGVARGGPERSGGGRRWGRSGHRRARQPCAGEGRAMLANREDELTRSERLSCRDLESPRLTPRLIDKL